MSVDTKGKKRKSLDNAVPAAKKVKTSTKASATESAPLKSALKKSTKTDAPVAAAKKAVVDKVAAAKTAVSKAVTPKATEEKTEKPAKSKKTTPKTKKPEVDAVAAEVDDNDNSELTADQTAALLAGFSSDEEEEAEAEDAGLDISTLPAPPVEKKKKGGKAGAAADGDNERTPGTIYIGRLPHGFFERQLNAYFTQFGTIRNLRLSRNRRTGKSQHHAFVEFASAAVADIVCKTMDKYLMFGHILQVRRVPNEQVNEKMWKGGLKSGRVMPRNKIEGGKLKRGMERERWSKRVENEVQRRKEKSEKLKELGYDFEMPEVKPVSAVPVKPKAIEGGENDSTAAVEKIADISLPADAEETTVKKTVEVKPGVIKTTVEQTVKRKNKAAEAPSTKKTKKPRKSV